MGKYMRENPGRTPMQNTQCGNATIAIVRNHTHIYIRLFRQIYRPQNQKECI